MRTFLLIIGLAFLCSIGEIYAQYDSTEVAKLRYFLLQESAEEGVKNYQQLGIENIDSVEWNHVYGLTFNSFTYLIERVYWSNKKLAGDADFSGFTALNHLYLAYNEIKNVNVDSSLALMTLDLYTNKLDSVDVKTNVSLGYLRLGYNNLKKIDLSNNPNMTFFCCTYNQVDTLDVSNKAYLKTLYCINNGMTYLNVDNCPALNEALCGNNNLSNINLENMDGLVKMDLNYNVLKNINIVNCPILKEFLCKNNELDSLDFSSCPSLSILDCSKNKLKTLSVNACTDLSSLTCGNNLLKNLDISGLNLSTLSCENNNMDYLTLPPVSSISSSYLYVPQQYIAMECIYDSIDLSDIRFIDDSVSKYQWFYSNTTIAPVKEEEGVFAFDESLVDEILICRVQNSSFPNLVMHYDITLRNKDFVANNINFVTNNDISFFGGSGCVYINAASATDVYIYSLSGLLVMEKHIEEGRTVLSLPRGLYVVKAGVGDGFKVVVK